MKPLTPQQTKAAWIVAGALVAIHFAPSIITSVSQSFRRSSITPSPAAPARASVLPPTIPASPSPAAPNLPDAQAARFLGVWTGSAIIPNEDRETCQIRLELRMSETDPGKIAGYETQSCIPALALLARRTDPSAIPKILEAASPVSAVLTGTLTDGALAFRVDKTVGTLPGHCPMTSYAVSPFGQAEVIAQWQEGSCPAGQMLLTKAKG